MTLAKARIIFSTHMQAARQRKLTEYETRQLNIARQVLRQSRKSIMNPPKHPRTTTYYQLGFDDAFSGIPEGGTTPIPPKAIHEYSRGYSVGLKYLEKRKRKFKKLRETGKSNPQGVLIYGQVETIYAKKTQNHICDDECKAHGHRYFHDFSSKPKMYGLPDGTILIKP